MLLLAPAADFTEALIWRRMAPDIRAEVMDRGEWQRPSAYGDGPYPITRALIEDGRRHLLLDAPIELGCPVHILQGMNDPDVPWQHALKLFETLVRQSHPYADQERRSSALDARGHRPHRCGAGRDTRP